MQVLQNILVLLDTVLGLDGRTATFTAETPLLGAVAELDSMAVVALITSLEEAFDITVDDDEISGDTFATVGSMVNFVNEKVALI
jgi:acyl carrier protein